MAGNGSIGTYYIQIEPSTGGMAKTIGQELDGGKAGEKYGKSFIDAVKSTAIGTAIGSMISQGIQMALGGVKDAFVQAFQGFADYQQYVGGIQKLYGNMGLSVEEYAEMMGRSVDEVQAEWANLEQAQNEVLRNAQQAYRTTGMSANEYMDIATSFSASLINSLGGDSAAAAAQTQVAMEAISDNWNTFGGDLENIQNAYRGFAKQNYSMLDNLKLGYGQGKQEMERLIADANEYARSIGMAGDLSIDSFSDIITAIDLIQQKQHIAGTTAREAASTVSGSLNMLSASWANFLTSLGDPNADMGARIRELLQSLGTAAANVIPLVLEIGSNVIAAIPEMVMQGFEAIRSAIIGNAESLSEKIAAAKLFVNLEKLIAPLRDSVLPVIQTLFEHLQAGVQGAMPILERLGATVMPMLITASEHMGAAMQTIGPILVSIADHAMAFLAAAANQLITNLQRISPVVGPVIDLLGNALAIALQFLADCFEGLTNLVEDFGEIAAPVADAVFEAFEWLIEQLGPIIDGIGGFFSDIGEVIQDPLGALGDFVFGTETAADTVESSARDMSRAAKQGYGQVATQAKTSATTVASSAKTGTSSALNSIRSNMDAAVGVVRTDTQRMSAESAAQFQSIHSSASTQWNAVRDTIGQAMSKASGSVQSSASTIQQTINGIKGRTIDIKAQTNDVGGIANSVKSVLNSIQSKKTIEVNAYKTGINGVKVQKNLIGGVLDAIRLVAFAQGGIVSSPTMAVIGEAGYSEAVVPLSPNGLRPFASALAEQLDGGTRGVVINVQKMEVRKESDIDLIANRLNNMVSRANGGRL